MYSNGSSHFSKQKMQAQRKMHYHSKGKSCGYYMRIIFFFSSLIQSLIIVSLVLFLVYGKPQDSASTARVEDLEKSFSRLSIENVALRAQRKNLTNLLNVTLIDKARNDWDLARLRYFSNISASIIQDLDRKVQQYQTDLMMCRSRGVLSGQCPPMQPGHCQCDMFVEQLRARLDLVASNFTQTTQVMRRELDQTAKERDNLHLAVIGLRRDKFMHEKEVELYKQRCKEDFVESLSGVSNVTRAFLQKVESLFPTHIAFQLTCPKQREHLEQIRTNCTSLSREVEDKFQRYLNNVGNHVSGILGENSRLKAENGRLNDDYRTCSQNRTGLIQQHKQNVNKLQQKHDTEKEALLIDKMKLNGEIEVLNNNVRYKSMEVEHIKEQLRQLNMSCMAKFGMGAFPGGPGGGQFGRMGSGSAYGSYGSTANKPVSPALNSPSSSVMSTGYGSSGGYGANRQGSTASGSSSSSTGYGSSGGYGTNRQGSTGSGSTGTGSSSSSTGYGSSGGYGANRQGSTGSGSTGSGSSSSTGYGSSSGYGTNRQGSTGSGSTGSGSTGTGSSSSSTGYGSSGGYGASRQGSTGSGSTGTGSSSSSTGYGSSSGYGASRQGSTGSGSTGSGSSASSTGYGSSSGVGVSKQGSTGSGSSSSSTGYGSSSGVGVSKQGSTGSGSSASSSGSAVSGRSPSTAGSSVGSVGASQNVGSSGTGVNKPTASVKSSPTSGSTASTSKSGSGSSGWWWGSSSSQSKTGSGTAKGPSSGTSYSGSSTAGRTNGLGGGSVSVAQHLQDLQRLINPSTRSGPEDRQDLSRMMG